MESAVPTIHLQPGKGISGLCFGVSRLAVHDFLGVPRSSGQSAIGCEADQWPGVAAYFSSDDRLQALELRSPCVFALDGTIISALGFDVPEVEMASFTDDVSTERALVVTRFDRQWRDDRYTQNK